MRGYIKIYIGPMFAAKTTRMLSDIETIVRSAGKKACIVKYIHDKRYDSLANHGGIVTHAGLEHNKIPIIQCVSIGDIYDQLCEYEIIGVSETQFISDLTLLNELADDGKYIVCEGLLSDAKRRPFMGLATFMAVCDEIVSLSGVCGCGVRSSFTAKKSHYGEQVDIGGEDKYTAVCRECYQKYA